MRKLAIFAGSFSLGIFLAQYLLPTDWLLPAAVLCLGLGCGALLLPWEWRRRGVVIGAALALALGYDWLYTRQVQRPMEALVDQERPMTMALCDYAVPTSYGAKATVKLAGLPFGKAVYYGGEELLDLRPGQTVTDLVRFQSASKIRDDDVTTFTSKGVFLLAYQRGTPVYGEGTSGSVRWWPARFGYAMREQIQTLFDGDIAGFLTAILTGDKSGLSEQAAADLSEAGMYHILAVSGMHCGFLLAIVTLLAGRHRRRLVAGCTIPLLVFYALLTGGSPSVLRACVMLGFLLAAPLFRRDSDGPTALTAALFLILLANPFAAASISLQLSFGAMAGILWLTPRLYQLLLNGKKGKTAQLLAASFSATMGALVFTVPLSAYYFQTLVLISLVSNLLCLWAASVVFILGLAAVLVSFALVPLGLLVGWVPALLIRYILLTAHLLAKVPYHAVYFSNPYLKYWLGYVYLLFGGAYFLGGNSRRKYGLSTVLAVLTLVLSIYLGIARYHSDLDAIVLDVGQGQSVVLASGGEFALVDCGSGNSWYDAGETAGQQLQSMGCRRLDYLILTHYDFDHVSGVTGLLARMDVESLLVPEGMDDAGLQSDVLSAAETHGVSIRFVNAEETLPLGNGALRIFPPLGDAGDNERGLAVLASAGETDLLITGDMDSGTERRLLETFDLPDIEALVVGHHGSKYSTSDDLLDALQPETACISVGSNSYGHPTGETIRRLAEHGCAIYRTDMQGSIHLSFN